MFGSTPIPRKSVADGEGTVARWASGPAVVAMPSPFGRSAHAPGITAERDDSCPCPAPGPRDTVGVKMVSTPIPRWLAALDEEGPYLEVLDGEIQPDVSPYDIHGDFAVNIVGAHVGLYLAVEDFEVRTLFVQRCEPAGDRG